MHPGAVVEEVARVGEIDLLEGSERVEGAVCIREGRGLRGFGLLGVEVMGGVGGEHG